MKDPKVYLTSLIITIIATLALATGTILILILMFSVHDNESAHPTGLFGSVYFQSAVEHSHNTVKATMGVASLPRLGGGRRSDLRLHPAGVFHRRQAQNIP